LPSYTAFAVYFSRPSTLRRLKLRLHLAPPSESRMSRSQFRYRSALKRPTQNTAAKSERIRSMRILTTSLLTYLCPFLMLLVSMALGRHCGSTRRSTGGKVNMPYGLAVLWLLRFPAPFAITSGNRPRMKAKEVIRIGRSRNRASSDPRFRWLHLVQKAASGNDFSHLPKAHSLAPA